MFKLNWILPGCLGFLLVSSPADAARLLSWRFDATQNRLVLATDEGVKPKVQLIGDPTRLVIDLPDTILEESTVEQLVGGAIRAVRVGQFDARTTRLVIELNSGYNLNPQEIQFQKDSSSRWVVQLPLLEPVVPSFQAKPLQPPTVLPKPTIGNPVNLPNFAEESIIVMLDPGHGGQDSGAIGLEGLQEKDVILSIAQKVATLLVESGIKPILTRTDDYFVDLSPRVEMAKQNHAHLFVSIHANSIDNRPDVNGLETYYYSNGQKLAQTVHNTILQEVNLADREVKQANFYVLRNNPMPAILVEVGFVTGEMDEPRLATTDYQNQLAHAIADGILRYIQQSL
jgi:N-acetylmuramoyl-L-alanine amidase